MQIATECAWPLLVSQRSESILLSDAGPSKEDLPEIVEFLLDDRAVRFANGRIEKNVDRVLFCTGYFYSFPFLTLPDTAPVIGDGTHCKNLYLHMFYRPHPTLAFPTLPQRVIPFPLAEVQSAVISRVWSGRLTLPSESKMKAWEDEVYAATGGGRDFHLLSFPKDADYMVAMYEWAMSAADGRGKGKEPPRWNEREYWLRERFAAVKKAFQNRGEDRHAVRTVEELGFDFDQFRKTQSEDSQRTIPKNQR